MTAPDSTAVFLNETGIAWPTDPGNRFKNTPNASKTQWIDIENGKLLLVQRELNLIRYRAFYGLDENCWAA